MPNISWVPHGEPAPPDPPGARAAALGRSPERLPWTMRRDHLAVGQNPVNHFGVGAPPI